MSAAETRLARRLRPELDSIADALTRPSLESVRHEAYVHLERAREYLSSVGKRSGLPKPQVSGPTPASRRADRNERMPGIRRAVMERAGVVYDADGVVVKEGCCEFCHRCGFRLEWFHVIGGQMRRKEEAVDTTAGSCWDCHRGWERNDMDVMRSVKEWAIRNGFKRALAAVEKKIDKVTEARRA